MDITSIIEIIVAVLVVFFLIKFIVSPIIKIFVGIISVLILFYILQKYFGFDIDKVLSPFGISLNMNNWGQGFNWILSPINYFADQIKIFINFIWENINKSIKLKT